VPGPRRVVIDANLWISALLSPSAAPAGVLRAVLGGQLTAVASPQLLAELAGVLEREKFRRWVSTTDAEQFVQAVAGKAELHPDMHPPRPVTRDPDDDYLVALADTAGALLVTGDADLLDADLDPPALTPRALLDLL
jgi:putative PIN family toxin of toxin-antitoxin system